MRDLLEQITAIPGVVGCLLYAAGGQVLASEFPRLFDPGLLQGLAGRFADDTVVMGDLAGTGAFLDLRYAEGRLILRPAGAATFLVLCTHPLNLQLLNLSLVQASRRLEKELVPAQPAAPPTPVGGASLRELKGVAEEIKHAFIQKIGPIGEMVFEQVLGAWSADPSREQQGLQGLVARLLEELEDERDRSEFSSTVRGVLAQSRGGRS